ncbi:hypothetical protein T261_00359 [Streptomyces lydicus]|nr:hypothetical protein T261_00359 [Streptomyces lydicus]
MCPAGTACTVPGLGEDAHRLVARDGPCSPASTSAAPDVLSDDDGLPNLLQGEL